MTPGACRTEACRALDGVTAGGAEAAGLPSGRGGEGPEDSDRQTKESSR